MKQMISNRMFQRMSDIDLLRAARALCSLQGLPENTKFEGAPMWQSFLPQADAVLKAIREPSERMIAQGSYVDSEDGHTGNAFAIYTAMIDAALKES